MMAQFSLFAPLPASAAGMSPALAAASYSADTIGMTGTVRKPVKHDGILWVSVGGSWQHGNHSQQMYELRPLAEFDGPSLTYAETFHSADLGDAARKNPLGGYHGMRVKSGGAFYVLVGPPQIVCGSAADLIGRDDEDEDDFDDSDSLSLFDDDDEDIDDELRVRMEYANGQRGGEDDDEDEEAA